MKLNRLFLPAAALLATCIYLSCQKTDTPTGPEPGTGHQVELVTAHVSGRVVDDQKLPVNGATIRIGTTTVSTDINGLFTANNVQVDKTAALVKVEKEGFFKGIKTLVVTPNKDNTVTIELLPKTVTGTFAASGGGTVSLPSGGGSIVFEANSIMNPANNAGYTGAVSVSAFFINPTASNFEEIMPGTLRGIDANNNVTGLQSFGMMAVELTGSGNEKLQLAGGKKATIRFPIPATLQAQAPATIPLWSLNDTTGLWKEEGVATRQGNEYVGSVGHFSYWNCDAPFPIVPFSATIKTQQNTPLANTLVKIEGTGSDSTLAGFGYTNSEGLVTGMIPANRNLVLKVYDKCNSVLLTKNVGPYTSASDLGTITVSTNLTTVTFSGSVVNCNAAPVTNGYVTIELDGFFYRASLNNGAFSTAFTRCVSTPSTAKVVPYDITDNVAGAEQPVAVSGTAVNTGQLTACSVVNDETFTYTIDGKNNGFTAPADSLSVWRLTQGDQTNITVERRDYSETVFLTFTGAAAPGTSELKTLIIRESSNMYTQHGGGTVTITQYENVPGGLIRGTFTGMVKDTTTSNMLPINLTFRLKRD